ncbi:hybrid sensor histidine kinase/response regulator transcription factor [Flavitalea sp.]|nr:substrate-binding domain-containing protein [Flavitalea sp.]
MKNLNHVISRGSAIAGKLTSALVFLILFFSLVITSCERKPKQRNFIIGFSQCTGDENWKNATLEGIKKEMAFYPGSTFIYRNASDSSDLQIKQIRELLTMHIDILLVSPNEARPLTPVIEEAYKQGIPVVVIDRRTSSDLYTSFVGVNNFEIGKMAGTFVANTYKDSTHIIEVTGLPGSTPTGDRQRGFSEGLRSNPKIRIKARVPGDWLQAVAGQRLTDIADQLSPRDVVFAHNDPMALGAYQVYKKLGWAESAHFIGVDGLASPGGGMELVSDKLLEATLLTPTGGEEALQIAFKILQKQPYERENTLQTIIIDSTNVRMIKLQADKITSQQLDIEHQQAILGQQQKIYEDQSNVVYVLMATLLITLTMGGIILFSLNENRRINKRLKQKNEEILNNERKLILMSEKAQAANDAKLKLFTNISHEFRTPLTLILAPLEELLFNTRQNFRLNSRLQLVQKNVIRLLRMVNQLMDFRKIEFGQLKLRATENDLVEFITSIADAFKPLAEKKQIDLQLIIKDRNIPLWFDTNMLDKVLFNLLSNSFKFTAKNGFVHIIIEKTTDKNVSIIVQDNGVGMTQEALSHAFEQFYQGEFENYKGTGLGLALSKELIQLHHGSIRVESEKWKGTTFYIELPQGYQHLETQELAEKESDPKLMYEDERIFITDLEEEIALEEANIDVKHSQEFSVLVIEDNADLRSFICTKLGHLFQTFQADNSNGALELALAEVPDVIICDVVIPGKSGIELTQILKSDIRTSHIPVILLTAKTGIEDQIEGMKNMADAYITKPFNLRLLEQTIKSLLANRAKLREHYSADMPAAPKTMQISRLDRKFLTDFKALVEQNISNEDFNVEDICKSLCVSKVQLYRKIKALLDCNVNDYILNCRLQKAKYLLQHEGLNVGEVASRVGFSSQAYFATVFKTKLGVTPTAFKLK